MRLTLRTLLAYMDNILDPADHEALGKKLESSEFATELIHRSRDVVGRMRLGAPKVDAGDDDGDGVLDGTSYLDANAVAEYLDNTMPAEQVAEFERRCLEAGTDADIRLAEVSSAHQILTMVLGEPAEVSPEVRARMYGLLEKAQAQDAAEPVGEKLRIEPAHADAAGAATVGTATVGIGADGVESDGVESDGAAFEPAPARTASPPVAAVTTVPNVATDEVPDYLRAAAQAERRGRKRKVAVTIAVALILGAGTYFFWPLPPVEDSAEVAAMGGSEALEGALEIGDGMSDEAFPEESSSAGAVADGGASAPAFGGTTEAGGGAAPAFGGSPAAGGGAAPSVGAGGAGEESPSTEIPETETPTGGTGEEAGATELDATELGAMIPPVVPTEESPAETEPVPPVEGTAGGIESTPAPLAVGDGLGDTPAPLAEALAEAAEETATTSATTTSAGGPTATATEPPMTDIAGIGLPVAAGPRATAAGSATAETDTGEVTDPVPPKRTGPVRMGSYVGNNDVLLRYDSENRSWTRLPTRTALASGDQLMVLPKFRTHLVLADGVNAYLSGGTQVTLAPETQGDEDAALGEVAFGEEPAESDVKLGLDFGRLLLVAGLEGNRVTVVTGGVSRTLELGPSASLAVEARRQFVPGGSSERLSPMRTDWYLTSGSVQWNDRDLEGTGTWTTFNEEVGEPQPLEEVPEWSDREPLTELERSASERVLDALPEGAPINIQLLELADTQRLGRRSEVRSLAVEAGAYVGVFEPFVKALSDEKQRAKWSSLIQTMRQAIARDARTAELLREDFTNLRGEREADDLMEMLLGYSDAAIGASAEQRKEGALPQLVRWLDSDKLDYRVLASYNLNQITGKNLGGYRPERTASQRRTAIRRYWKELEEGRLKPLEDE